MSGKAAPKNYEDEVLFILAYEFPHTDKTETEDQIRKKLKRAKLGPYEQERIDLLRRFKDDIQAEVSTANKSKYFTHEHGEYFDHRRFANDKDFDAARMTEEYAAQFPAIPRQSIQQFVAYAIYLYYLR